MKKLMKKPMKKPMKKLMKNILQLPAQVMLAVLMLVAISACTKSRKAELPEEQKVSVFAISEFGEVSENSLYEAQITAQITSTAAEATSANSAQALDNESKTRLFAHEVNVPSRIKFMFDNLPISNLAAKKFKITFSVDKNYVTAYKVVKNLSELSVLEKSIALSAKEVQLLAKAKSLATGLVKAFSEEQRAAVIEKNEIKTNQKEGALLVPLFKYKIQSYGVLTRTKNELKEETARLAVKATNWKDATHIQLSPQTDSRLVVGLGVDQVKELKQIYNESKIDNQTMTANELQKRYAVAMKFMSGDTKLYTRLGADSMYVYEITTIAKLTESQARLLKNNAGNQQILSCQDQSVAAYIKSSDQDCVIVLSALIPVTYKSARLPEENESGSTSPKILLEDVQKINSVGLVEIKENIAARQLEVTTSGILDPNSTIKLSDIKGEFFYRRTFESASNMFLGYAGTSGDMIIIRFELEDKRLVVRNQQSLIAYTGQGPKDREEMMSFPVSYFRMTSTNEHGNKLTIPLPIKATKENAEYALIDWTNNTVPDANSPLAFYAGGNCFMANSSLSVTDTDMRLATDGILNYSLSGSYTVKPTIECVATKDVNSAYWSEDYQFNFNITERISFMKHKNADADLQFTQNISSMAQAAFNFGVFTLADKITGTGALANRDGSEKYMPMIYDLRNGKKIRWYLGGINNPALTSPERRQLLLEATQQVVEEWNRTLKLSFKGTALQRASDYIELVVDDKDSAGHLGDLDRNYIWLNELPAKNGLLGVAQPAANPRSGTIQSVNVIVYTGNTYNQTEAMLKITKISRDYEKAIDQIKAAAVAEAAAEQKVVSTAQDAKDKTSDQDVKSGKVDATAAASVKTEIKRLQYTIAKSVKALQLDNAKIKTALKGMKKNKNYTVLKTILSKDVFKHDAKGQVLKYEVNRQTFLKKLTDIASNNRAANNPNSFELAVNQAFINYANLDENVKQALKKRSQLLAATISFDENMKNRPGCFTYARNDINDQAQILDSDPKKNLMLNFKKNVMSTLSHELGHAFGLLHNFKASTDKANYEFKNQKVTGRNYSSIMDYIEDLDMNYQGPGPYDAHAIRAAYTGMVERAETDELVSIAQIVKDSKVPLVHFTKDTINQAGILKHYAQCDDGGVNTSVLCARWDTGGSATEIVNNLISDYHRTYVNRNYVHDKILFGWPQKIQLINGNISLFQNIRSFLDEAITSLTVGTGLPEAQSRALIMDQLKAAKLGYTFFHELLRTPDAQNASIMHLPKVDNSDKDKKPNAERFFAIPYKYKNAKNEEVSDIKIIEARSAADIRLDKTRDKFDTLGISFDKAFAMLFLLQSTAAQVVDDNNNSQISYLDFEQFLMGIRNPADSLTMQTILQILQNDLTAGFFMPSNIEVKSELSKEEFEAEAKQFQTLDFKQLSIPVSVGNMLAEQTTVGTIIGLTQSKWRSYDAFAETFKVGKSNVNQAPKDRPNVAKMEQDKSLDDTKVLYAAQNAVGASALVNLAARNEFFILNKNTIFAGPMLQIYSADMAYIKMISKIQDAACAKGKDDPACKTAMQKKDEVYFSENADIAAEKAKADLVAAAFVAQLRALNTSGIILAAELDVEESPVNLSKQVESLRQLLVSQINVIFQVKLIIENTPADKLEATIQNIVQALFQIKEKNSELESLHLLATAFGVISDVAATVTIEAKDGSKFTADVIAEIMMNADKLQEDLNSQLPTLETLATLSNLVDSDTIGK